MYIIDCNNDSTNHHNKTDNNFLLIKELINQVLQEEILIREYQNSEDIP